jgi:hypothetical protein
MFNDSIENATTTPAIRHIFVAPTSKKRKMKATTIIMAAVLALQANVLFSENDNLSAPVTFESTSIVAMNLAPSTPMEATFEEAVVVNEFSALAPSTPIEADFSDVAPVAGVDATVLAPTVPAEADFTDDPEYALSDM